jgi:hypothetical protein
MAVATRGDLLLKPLREWLALRVVFSAARILTTLICPGMGGVLRLAEGTCQLVWGIRTVRWLRACR